MAATLAYHVLFAGNAGMLSMTQEQLRICVVLLADTAELIVQPRMHEDVALSREGNFMKIMQRLMTLPGLLTPHGADGVRLLHSWRRLEQSGVLQRRGADSARQAALRRKDDLRSATTAAAAAPGLRSCALETCSARDAHPSHFKSCAACRIPAYCCKEHQTEDWPSHKAACKAARKAAAEHTTS